MNKFCEFDIVVFGASGYTGQYVVEELVRCADTNGIKWAISGRDVKKLRRVLEIATTETGVDVTDSPVIEADITSEESLRAMTKRTKVVLNCVGPYTTYGDPVIRSCIDTTTHYLDVSAEMAFGEDMQVKYDSAAKEKSVFIINSCGYTRDLWLPYVVREFNGQVSSVEVLMTARNDNDFLDMVFNVGTWKSMIEYMFRNDQLKKIKSLVFSNFGKKSLKNRNRRLLPFRSEHSKGLFVNSRVTEELIERTNRFRSETYNESAVKLYAYMDVGSYLKYFVLLISLLVIYVLSKFQWGRNLLFRHPESFSFGRIVVDGPSRQRIKNSLLPIHTYVVSGRKNQMKREPNEADPSDADTASDVEVYRFTGPELAYLCCSACLVQCGITIVKEANHMRDNVGVRTPGSVFGGTGVYDRLKQSGLTMLKV